MREPGPIPISKGLLQALHVCSSMRAYAEAEDDLDLAREASPQSEPTLAAADVARVEAALEATLAEDLLALCALRVPAVEIGTGITLDSMATLAGQAFAAPIPDGWVAIATLEVEPYAAEREGEHGAPVQVVCVERDPGPGEPTVLVLALRDEDEDEDDEEADEERPDEVELPLGAFVREQLALGYENLRDWMAILKSAADVEKKRPALARFAPALVGDERPAAPADGRRVRHAKFGEGTVLSEDRGGAEPKLTVAFDSAGTKTLLARFLTDV